MKKSTKGLMSALLLMAMCGAVGCGKDNSSSQTETSSSVVEQEQTVNLVSRLVDGGDSVYTVTQENGAAKVSYTKTGLDTHEWSSLQAEITANDNMSKMQTLRFALSGAGTVLLKIEGPSGNVEVKCFVTPTKGEYELNLANSAEKIADATKICLFAAPGVKTSSGEFTVHKLELTSATADGFIIGPGWSNIQENTNVYDGTTETFNINNYWTEQDADTYKFTYENGVTKVDYTKTKYTWAYAYTQVSGVFGKFDYLNLKVKGDANKEVLFKVEGEGVAAESYYLFNGEEQVLTLDLTGLTEAQRGAISKVLFFAEPDKAVESSFEIREAYFSDSFDGITKGYENDETKETFTYTGGQTFDLNRGWHDAGDEAYTVTKEADKPYVFNYNAENKETYSAIRMQAKGAFNNFTKITFGVKVPEGKEILIKVGSLTKVVKGTGDYDGSQEIDLSIFDATVSKKDDLKNLSEIVVIAEPGVANVSGSFEIHWMQFTGLKVNEYTGGTECSVNRFWQAAAPFTYVANENKFTFENATEDHRWAQVKTPIKGDFSCFEELEYDFVIPAHAKPLVKIEGVGDLGYIDNTASDEAKRFTGYFDLTDIKDKIKDNKEIIIFPFAGNTTKESDPANNTCVPPTSGELVINKLYFANAKTTVDTTTGKLNLSADKWNASGEGYTYTDGANGEVTVSYGTKKGYWVTTEIRFDAASLANYTKATLEFTGPAGVDCIFKLEGDGFGAEAKYEKNQPAPIAPMSGEKQTAELDITKAPKTGTMKFIVFADFNATNVTGDIIIHSLTFSA